MQLLSPISGKRKYQVIFEQLHQISLLGMNIGGGDNPQNSGEISVMKYIKNKLHAETKIIIFDVGANVGRYSLLLQDVFQDNCSIHAFEPSKGTFQKLLLNIENKENVNLNNFGFGDENKKMMLYYDSPGSGLASVYKRRLEKHAMNKNEEIEIKTIDSYCNDNNIKHIHFCKLDVEGHEFKVLKGAEKMLNSGSIDFIQFEFGGCNIDSKTYFKDFYYFFKDNYTIYRILKDGLRQIKKYKEKYEIFVTTNFLVEKKKAAKISV